MIPGSVSLCCGDSFGNKLPVYKYSYSYDHICPFHRSESDSISGNWYSILHHEGSLLERVPSCYSSLGSFEVHPLSLEFRRIHEEQAMLCLWGSTLLLINQVETSRRVESDSSIGSHVEKQPMNSLFHSSVRFPNIVPLRFYEKYEFPYIFASRSVVFFGLAKGWPIFLRV